ncbi:xylose isomerase [Candidatus Poribacteria bacterium]|nr:xylose isomerase [Candidatus Poribacteria bacterium]
MKLGVDTYSLRSLGWGAFEHLEYAREMQLDAVQFSERGYFDSLDEEYLRTVKARADEFGIEVNVGMLSICQTSTWFSDERGTAAEQLAEMIRVADIVGSPFVRCVLGGRADRRTEEPLTTHIAATVETCRAVRDLALEMGVKVAIENHAGDLQARELRGLIEAAGPEYVGACIDTGNAVWAGESPFVALEHLAPYVVTSHIRDAAVWEHPRGVAMQWLPMGDGTIGLDAWVREFERRCPDASLTVEIIAGRPPQVLNYLEPEYWEAYPDTPASEFAQFVALAKAGGPYMGSMLVADGGRGTELPSEYEAAMTLQQRAHLDRSIRYCQDTLGIGEKRGQA